MAAKLRPDPIKWTLGDRFLPESTERDGLRFTIKHDHWAGQPTNIAVERASDGYLFGSVQVSNQAEAETVVRTWDLEEWRARVERDALNRAARALEEHRKAMTRLNEIRAIRVHRGEP